MKTPLLYLFACEITLCRDKVFALCFAYVSRRLNINEDNPRWNYYTNSWCKFDLSYKIKRSTISTVHIANIYFSEYI